MGKLKPLDLSSVEDMYSKKPEEWESFSDIMQETSSDAGEIVDTPQAKDHQPWTFKFEPVDKEATFSSEVPPSREEKLDLGICSDNERSSNHQTEEYVPWVFDLGPADKEPSFSSDIPPTLEQKQRLRNMGKNIEWFFRLFHVVTNINRNNKLRCFSCFSLFPGVALSNR